MSSKSVLLSPVKIGMVELSNRVVLAPLTRGRATAEGHANDLLKEYYTQRASAGLLITEATGISRQGLLWHHAPGIYTKEQVESWKPVTESVHQAGGKIFLQLWHMGRAGHSETSGMKVVAPSPIPLTQEVNGKNGKKQAEVPHELTTEEVESIVEDFGNAAENAMEAGFDGVEVHFANGYLPDTFLQSSTNKRADKYGGSLEGRLTFLVEVLDRVLNAVPAGRVGIRFSPNGAFQEMGSEDNIETFTAAIKEAGSRDLAYIHVMDGLGFGYHEKCKPFTLAMARTILEEIGSKSTIMGNVEYTKELAEERIENGEADTIAFGRPFISNPDLVERFRLGLELAPTAPYEHWWTTSLGATGYTDYPAAVKQEE